MGASCKHCNQPITPCDGREYSCLGWIHVDGSVVGSHICQTDGMIARAEPERAQPYE